MDSTLKIVSGPSKEGVIHAMHHPAKSKVIFEIKILGEMELRIVEMRDMVHQLLISGFVVNKHSVTPFCAYYSPASRTGQIVLS